VVATDAAEIAEAVEAAGYRAVLTSSDHGSGTDRVAEVARRGEFDGADIVLNVQGDEPFVLPAALHGAVARVRGGDDVGTAAAPLTAMNADDPGRVKVVFDAQGRALYFSRAPIPFYRDVGTADRRFWQHIGVYAYRRDALRRWAAGEPTPLERAERLEQLRALEYGLTMGVALLDTPAIPGVDTLEDLLRADALWTATARGSG
jgi:3-deoxy-manno-octulosonate cytidylyltransferase (CMP-KDO synthetase)